MQKRKIVFFLTASLVLLCSLFALLKNNSFLDFSADFFENNYFQHNRFLTENNYFHIQEVKKDLVRKQEKVINAEFSSSQKIFLNLQDISAQKDSFEKTKLQTESEFLSLQSPLTFAEAQKYPEKIIDNDFSKKEDELHAAYDKKKSDNEDFRKQISIDIQNLDLLSLSIKNQEIKTEELQKDLLHLRAIENFYSMLITSLDRRFRDSQEKTFTFDSWYRQRIREQADAFPFRWPVIPSLGISVGFQNKEYEDHFHVEHFAIDIQTDASYPVRSVADGIVSEIQNQASLTSIKIEHQDDFSSLYGHIIRMKVKEGEQVKKGDIIAYSGGDPETFGSIGTSTGKHLHFAVYKKGVAIDPLYLLDISLIPLEKIPISFDFEKYFSQIAFSDYDGDGLQNIYEFSFARNMYRFEKFDEKEIQKINGIEFLISDFIEKKE